MSLPPFERVLADHGAVVLRVCRAVLGPVDAEDAWSDTFLAAFEAYPRLSHASNLRGWLVTIAHRKSLDRARRAGRSEPLHPLPDRGSTDRYPSEDEHVWAALAQLPTGQRLAVAYHHIAGLPYAEIAELTGGTAAAARRASSDGIAALRRNLVTKERR